MKNEVGRLPMTRSGLAAATLVAATWATATLGAATGCSDDGSSAGTGGVGAGEFGGGASSPVGPAPGTGAAPAGTGAAPGGSFDALQGVYPTTVTEASAAQIYESWKSQWVTACGDGSLRVKWDTPDKTVSEGIGYGMLLAAAWGDRTTLDGLFAYYQNHLNQNGLMGWIGTCGSTEDSGAASDADLDVAMALIMADCQWSDGGYAAEATKLITAMKTHLFKADAGHTFLCAGDNWGADCCGNASYQAPAYYRAFGAFTGDTQFWDQAAADSYYYLDKYSNASTGLVPDWMDPDTLQCDAKDPGDWHGWDASRVPWRVTTDYAWWGIPEAQAYAQKVATWVKSNGGVLSTGDGCSLSGNCPGSSAATFAGAFASTGIASDQATVDQFFSDLKSSNSSGYFNAILNALYFTLAAKKFTPGCF